MWRTVWAPNSIPIYIQEDATLHSLFISGNCSTCFRWYIHPSSGAHTTVSTASVICHTVIAICHYRGRIGTGLSMLWVAYATHSTFKPVWQMPDAVDTVLCAPDDGRKYHLKHVEQFPDINKLCNVASCWIYTYIWNILTMHRPINVKSPNNNCKWQMGFNSAFKGLITYLYTLMFLTTNYLQC
jgi:hypothetical protein